MAKNLSGPEFSEVWDKIQALCRKHGEEAGGYEEVWWLRKSGKNPATMEWGLVDVVRADCHGEAPSVFTDPIMWDMAIEHIRTCAKCTAKLRDGESGLMTDCPIMGSHYLDLVELGKSPYYHYEFQMKRCTSPNARAADIKRRKGRPANPADYGGITGTVVESDEEVQWWKHG